MRLPNLTHLVVGGIITVFSVSAGTRGLSALPAPSGKPILAISGKIQVTNKNGEALFDLAMLEELGTSSVDTTTPWYQGRMTFQGVRLDKLMAHVGATGERVVAIALNDYSVEIPITDFERFGAILAYKRNGEYMPIRDKGPLFIVYPYDSHPELKSQTYYGRSAWQVSKIIVR